MMSAASGPGVALQILTCLLQRCALSLLTAAGTAVQVVTCLLQPSPNRRPSVTRLLESSVVQRHLATDAPPEPQKREAMLFKTIKVPLHL